MLFANDRIRLQFYGAFAGKPPLLRKVLDTRKKIDNGSEFDNVSNPDLYSEDIITFKKNAAFKQMYET